jgi:LysM repeat protein
MQASKIKIFAVATFITIAVLFCTSFYIKEETVVHTQYKVQKGDTLYSIAEDYGIKNWRKWAYETCKINGLEQGGLIYPGQIITIKITQ